MKTTNLVRTKFRAFSLAILAEAFVSGAAFSTNTPATNTPINTPATTSASQATPAAGATAQDAQRPVLQHRMQYQLQRSDALKITFPLAPEYDQTVTVRPDGFISLLAVGDVHVENMNTEQLHEAIRKAYTDAKILHEPLFTVDITDFQRPHFIVIGEVNQPGRYELREDTTVTGAVAQAGGFVQGFAKHSEIVVFHRIDNDWSEAKTINLKHLLKSKNLAEDLHLQPGDIVYVPQNNFTKFKSVVPYQIPLGFYQTFGL